MIVLWLSKINIKGNWIKSRCRLYNKFCNFFLLQKFFSEDLWSHPRGKDLHGVQGEEVDFQSNEYFYRMHTFISHIFSGLVVNLQIK